MTKYKDALTNAMDLVGARTDTVFLGQAVAVGGTAMSTTLKNIHVSKLIELPVEEEFQMGLANGLAMSGLVPICIFPRWNFLLLAVNQIVNHLDKFQEMGVISNKFKPKVIIRTGIGSMYPLDPGPQHTGDFTSAFKLLCKNIEIVRLDHGSQIVPQYERALERTDGVSTLLIEWSDNYETEF
jgi:pyruvate/2-oxoglutarate/acetoin dehydrogenase E1 component